jgi:hypothetical protein
MYLNTVKFEKCLRIFIATRKLLNLYWWTDFSRGVSEVYPLWYRSIDLSTDPGLKSHLITFPSQNELLHLPEPLYN